MNPVGIVSTRNFEVLPSWCARADEHGIIIFGEQIFQTVDGMIKFEVNVHIEDITDLLIKNFRRQSKLRNICPHQATGSLQRFEDRNFISERGEIVRDGQ